MRIDNNYVFRMYSPKQEKYAMTYNWIEIFAATKFGKDSTMFSFAQWLNSADASPELRFTTNESANILDLLKGAVQPLFYTIEDIKEYTRCYSGWYETRRELLQPLIGIQNICRGIANALLSAYYIPVLLIHAYQYSQNEPFFEKIGFTVSMTIIQLLDSASSICRGLIQIASYPITLFLKMPMRGLLTAFYGPQRAEADPELQSYIQEAKDYKEKQTNRAVLERDIDRYGEHIDKLYTALVDKGAATQIVHQNYSHFKACALEDKMQFFTQFEIKPEPASPSPSPSHTPGT